MRYLIVQDWNSTHGNHAGMVHMCKLLCEKWPCLYKMYVKPQPKQWKEFEGDNILVKFLRKLQSYKRKYYIKLIYPREYRELCKPMFEQLVDNDEVFLLEYLLPWAPQYDLACYIRNHYPYIKIYGLSHLTCKYFDQIISNNPFIIQKWAQPVDKILTFGSSLSFYFERSGIPKEKISTGLHYVDTFYYNKQTSIEVHSPLRIIMMGALQRDYVLLSDVVKRCPDVHWIICRGRKKVDDIFHYSDNVELKGYLDEDELRHQMDTADVSLNIMDDTIGSNVITTSMAMGLAMICSDVGSIRDYCSSDNCFFCNNDVDSFVKAISLLSKSREKVLEMKTKSILLSQKLNIDNVSNWFSSL